MKNRDQIITLLSKMQALLDESDCPDWAGKIKALVNLCSEGQLEASHIKVLYGGMGSLNDLVLYSHGELLINENIALDDYRHALYELIKNQ